MFWVSRPRLFEKADPIRQVHVFFLPREMQFRAIFLKMYVLYNPILTLLKSCFDKLDQEFSRCWSILAKNIRFHWEKCSLMIKLLSMLEYCFDRLEWKLSACWSILAKKYIMCMKKNVVLSLIHLLCWNDVSWKKQCLRCIFVKSLS